ncbi:hypothetical protein D3C84_1123200 [compost metagenome]
MSGRQVNRSDGRPTARSLSTFKASSWTAENKGADNGLPTSSTNAFLSCSTALEYCA